MHELKPDLALVLGDRSEALTFTFTCSLLGIPIAHFHGGEVSIGALDELHRHAITKLSSLHFPAAETSVKRIIQMGEQPNSVFFFGPLVADRLTLDRSVSREFLAAKFSFEWGEKTALITMHGAKFDNPSTGKHLEALLEACDEIEGLNLIFTGPNADPESQDLRISIFQYCSMNPAKAFFVESFGSESYLEMLTACDVAIGNSSSLVHEAPFVGIPIIILGSRQEGRELSIAPGLGPDSVLINKKIQGALCSTKRKPAKKLVGLSVSFQIAEAIASSAPISRKKAFWDQT
jgi:UDP-hydrolysing UDP-N-acetyl-D-glucosamine 2-epimerase